jgi:osmotically-inducible protein OsmY
MKQFDKMPESVEKRLVKSIRRNTEAAARLAKALVPVESGQLKGWIHTKYENGDGVYQGSVEAAPPTRDAQIKAKVVEFGRKKGIRGTTAAQPYIRLAQKQQGPKFKKSIKAAIKRGIKDATNG